MSADPHMYHALTHGPEPQPAFLDFVLFVQAALAHQAGQWH